ncbi:type II secretion system F family protein [archaeon]
MDATNQALVYAGMEMRPGRWLMFSIANSFLLGFAVAVGIQAFLGEELPMLFIGGTTLFIGGAFIGVFHNILVYYGGRRALQIELMLPDALQLIAANIRADIPIHKSLLLAARPEFGLLAQEIEKVGNSILGGMPTSKAFTAFGLRVKSPMIRRITTLMEEGLRSGHDLAGMLDQVAYDLRVFKILDEEAKANIGSYVIFIVMAVLVIAPVLYSISISFISLNEQVKETLNIGELVSQVSVGSSSTLVGLVSGDSGVSSDTLAFFAALNLAASAGIAAILVSVLETGEALQKMPYIPTFIVVAEAIFFVTLTVLRIVLGGIFA